MTTTAFYIPAAICIILTLSIVCFERYRRKQLYLRLDHMLDCAMKGTFSEMHFDESMLSSLETKFANYLNNCSVSAQNLTDEKNKIKELISDISHQTKTPIANIMLYTQLLSERFSHAAPDPEDNSANDSRAESLSGQGASMEMLLKDCGPYITALNAQTEKLNFLIHSLIKTSRLETGILSVNPSVNEIPPLITEVISQAASGAQTKGIRLQFTPTQTDAPSDGSAASRPGGASQTAVFDRKWTTEALYNIVDNAIKYTPAGGSVTVSTRPYEFFRRIDISDTGIGIPEEEQAKVFARFYRSPSVSDIEGIGIGLYLSRQIISCQGGYIKVSSTPGVGTTFSVFLPSGDLRTTKMNPFPNLSKLS